MVSMYLWVMVVKMKIKHCTIMSSFCFIFKAIFKFLKNDSLKFIIKNCFATMGYCVVTMVPLMQDNSKSILTSTECVMKHVIRRVWYVLFSNPSIKCIHHHAIITQVSDESFYNDMSWFSVVDIVWRCCGNDF